MIKFNYGVEIGANLAYMGHFKRTNDQEILKIANEEIEHRESLALILSHLDEKPCKYINFGFTCIGKIIFLLCQISPIFLLDIVARCLELFAIFSYKTLAKKYPQYKSHFLEMSQREAEHEKFFNKK